MGIEFVRKAAPKFRKGLDKRRIELSTPNLFTQAPACGPRTYAASLRQGESLAAGDQVVVRFQEKKVVLMRGINPVGEVRNPPGELVDALVASHGIACGRVQEIHDIAYMAEISVCR
jgi:hypothetical protein